MGSVVRFACELNERVVSYFAFVMRITSESEPAISYCKIISKFIPFAYFSHYLPYIIHVYTFMAIEVDF